MFRNRAAWWMYAVAVLSGLGAIVPLSWLFLLSLDPGQGATSSHFVYSLQNYANVLFDSLMVRYFFNTFVVAALTVLCTLACACMGAYAASRFRFRGREVTMIGLLAASMTPIIAVLVPLYAYAAQLHMLNTYQVLIIIFTAWQLPGTLWLMRSFIDAVPIELEEAALVDGCSRAGAFFRIVLPQLVPGLIAAGLIVFVYVWNEFIIAVSLAPKQEMRLVSVGLYFYLSEYGVEWGKISAGAILSIIPPAVLFLFLQRKLIHGLNAGALK